MNTLPATLTAITSSEHLSILTATVGVDTFHLLLAEQCHDAIGSSLTLAFKETELILSKAFMPTTANIHYATVSRIESGIVLTKITLNYLDTNVTALVPSLSFDTLEIDMGDSVAWIVQPSEISLLRGHHGI